MRRLALPTSNSELHVIPGSNRQKQPVRSSSSSMSTPRPLSPLSSPTASATFQIPSTTHANGIQPSASFFHPSRPNNVPVIHSRPSSALSSTSSHQEDVYPLAPLGLNKKVSLTSDDDAYTSDPEVGPMSSTSDLHHRQFKPKLGRDALLPISPARTRRPTISSAPIRPSIHSTLGPPPEHVTTDAPSPSRGIRTSFDRVLRRLSLDSSRKSSGSPGPTFLPHRESEHEDRVLYPLAPPRTKLSSSPLSHSPTPTRLASPSPSTFISKPPAHPVPLSEMPLPHAPRNYRLHPSRNRFLLNGRLLTGGDSPLAFLLSLFVLFSLAGVWIGGTLVWWARPHGYGGAGGKVIVAFGVYMIALVFSNMMATAMRDPGILPRNLDSDPPRPSSSSAGSEDPLPFPRDLRVRSEIVRVKYCPTCKTYRPPRSSHCKMCDNCVDGCDHHCQWVNNCVGRRNYTSFFAFILSAVLTLIFVLVTSALHISIILSREQISFRKALGRAPASAVAFCMAAVVVWPVTALLVYHMRLLLLNVTTIEQIRNQAHKTLLPSAPAPPNPFSHRRSVLYDSPLGAPWVLFTELGTWRRNAAAVLCRPPGFSWIDARGIAVEDRRGVNPGLVNRAREVDERKAEEGRREREKKIEEREKAEEGQTEKTGEDEYMAGGVEEVEAEGGQTRTMNTEEEKIETMERGETEAGRDAVTDTDEDAKAEADV